jgi:hypothetical protein
MKKSIFLILVMTLTLISTNHAMSDVVFPESTTLCAIRARDKFASVIKKFGHNYLLTESGGEDSTWVIIYNDPKTAAHLIINSGENPFQGIKKSVVCSIILKQGYYKGKKGHLATKSFANLKTFLGAKIGDSKKSLKKIYPKMDFQKDRNGEYGNIGVQSPGDWPCYYRFTMRKGRVVEIFSGFIS